MMLPTPLPIARYRFTARALEPIALPLYAGSLLRGVFGAALRRVCCMTKLPSCAECPLHATCPYPSIFESPPRPTVVAQNFSQVPNPYIIEPPPLGTRYIPAHGELQFNMVLVGNSTLRQLPLIIHTWQRALNHGLGAHRSRAELATVDYLPPQEDPIPIWRSNAGNVAEHAVTWSPLSPPPNVNALVLRIHTPLRLQHNGHALGPQALSAATLCKAALRRTQLILDLHCNQQLTDAVQETSCHRLSDDRTQLTWQDWKRYSARQQQEMTLGGVLGSWVLYGEELGRWYRLLYLMQWLHVGKNATMGMGGYTLEAVS